MDQRIRNLAKNIVNYSIEAKTGDKVLIEASGVRSYPLIEAIIEECYKNGALPFYLLHDDMLNRAQLMNATKEQFEAEAEFQLSRMQQMNCYIGIRASENVLEMADVPSEKMKILSSTVMKKVHGECRSVKTRWVVMRYPNPTFAQSAKMSTHEFEDFYFDCCLIDYSKMSKAMDPLFELMKKTDKVRIKSPGTELSFSIKDIPVIKCDGKLNIPDGEIFTAPVKESLNGTISFNTPSVREGQLFDGIKFTFKDGKIVEESCETGDAKKLKSILDRDEGSRYVGEFAIGVNPKVNVPMMDTLFDEKIAGSIHFAVGKAYDMAFNGNNSEIHWDIVLRQTTDLGGGEIWFDDVLIRKDGLFVLEYLQALNP
ncbi:MAG: aminopeptidase [Pseudomonadota bacterium]